MTPAKQNEKIAEWMGYEYRPGSFAYWGATESRKMWFTPNGSPVGFVPNYHDSLDAIHEAEKQITSHSVDADYYGKLCTVCDGFNVYRATAPQRCEALLRTLNLWTEEETN